MNTADQSKPVTKSDISNLEKLLNTAVNMIFERFDSQDTEIAEVKASNVRIENKLDPTINQVDDHENRISKLEPAVA